MDYISQINNLVEVLRFLLSKVPDDHYSDDVKMLKYLANLHSEANKQQNKEEGELVTFSEEHEADSDNEPGKNKTQQ